MKKKLVRFVASILVTGLLFSSPTVGISYAADVPETDQIAEEKDVADSVETGGEEEVPEEGQDQGEDEKSEGIVEESGEQKDSENIVQSSNDQDDEVAQPEENGEIKFNYVYVEKSYIESETEQNIVVSWGDGSEQIDSMDLVYSNDSGEQFVIENLEKNSELFLFRKVFNEDETGVYQLQEIRFEENEQERTVDFSKQGMQIYFGVNQEYDEKALSEYLEMGAPKEEQVTASIATIDGDGVVTEMAEEEISGVLDRISDQAAYTAIDARKSPVVVVLDPGHDSKHAGARANDVEEEVATLKIAQYCKAELEQYLGVVVYMTRETASCPFPNSKDNIDDIKKRVQWAASKGADAFVSFHLDSAGEAAHGAHVYYPGNWFASNSIVDSGAGLAQKIQNELVRVGLYNRGTESADYAVNTESAKCGFPGLIIEHAFLTNANDANKYLKTEAGLKSLGVADATGIANYFGLSKGQWIQEGEKWKYKFPSGEYAKNGIVTIGGKLYYFDSSGYRQTGWIVSQDKKKYYGMPDGSLREGWLSFGSTYYYCGDGAALVTGKQQIEGLWYYFAEGQSIDSLEYGKRKTDWIQSGGDAKGGWVQEGEKWKYKFPKGFPTGEYAKNEVVNIDGKWYYFDKSGYRQTGWIVFENKKYYGMPDGSLREGWLSFGSTYYYCGTGGALLTGRQEIEGEIYYFVENQNIDSLEYGKRQDNWVDPGEDGSKIGWIQEGEKWKYRFPTGEYAKNGVVSIDGKLYYFDENGYRLNGWIVGKDGKKYYGMPDGSLREGWLSFGNTYYYCGTGGGILTGRQNISGKWYYFTEGENISSTAYGKRQTEWIEPGNGKKYYGMPDGSLREGWLSFGNIYYYCGTGGEILTGRQNISGKWYYFTEGKNVSSTAYGKRQTSWIEPGDGKKYYGMPDGSLREGWLSFGNTYYYCGTGGEILTGKRSISGKWYYFTEGENVSSTAYGKRQTSWIEPGDGKKYYGMPDGSLREGWLSFGNTYYYCGTGGGILTGKRSISGKWYYFTEGENISSTAYGKRQTGWIEPGDGKKYYGMPDGSLREGWLSFGNIYYYCGIGGAIVTGWQNIDGERYYFDENGVREEYYRIESATSVTIDQMVSYFMDKGKKYPEYYKSTDAPTIRDFCTIYYEEAADEGINAEVAFAQAMKETAWLKFGGDVKIEQKNFAGIGTIGGGVSGASFPTVREGIRAQIQHLKAYGSTKALNKPCVDPRFSLVTRGTAIYVEWLGIQENPYGKGWATAKGYGYDIVRMVKELKKY